MGKSKKYKYMISYVYSCKLYGFKSGGTREYHGRKIITRLTKIETEGDILSLEQFIKTTLKGCTDLHITGVYKLKR